MVNCALPGEVAALERFGCDMAAMAAKFWTASGLRSPAAAAALVVSCVELFC